MKNIQTGEIIVGSLVKTDLVLGEILGNGASGYVYAALHKPTGKQVALKSINVHDKGKRHQMINDLRALSDNECPFLVQFLGAMFDEGSVKVALELMDMGSLKDIIKLAKLNPNYRPGQPLFPEAILAKIT
jgi:serine/threonine protein kinase